MTFIVGDNCIRCKHTDCVEVCPVDCFYEGPNFLVIHPDECIDCALCEPECPVDAIYAEDELPEDQQEFPCLECRVGGSLAKHHREERCPARCRGMDRQEEQTGVSGALVWRLSL